MRITVVVGVRPHFPKLAAMYLALRAEHDVSVVHTGQHFDEALSTDLLADLGLPTPDRHLQIGSGSHAEQTARGLLALEPVLRELTPDLVVVIGDGNSTLVGALVAAKLGIAVAHVEAGVRSFDRSLPEEVNRLAIDAVSVLHLAPHEEAVGNLRREGRGETTVLVGDLLLDLLDRRRTATAERLARWRSEIPDLADAALVTFHRSGTLRDRSALAGVVEGILAIPRPVVCALHPGTEKALAATGLADRLRSAPRVRLLPALPHTDLLALLLGTDRVYTDSNGVQREALFLGKPCFVLRESTEFPATLDWNAGALVGTDPAAIAAASLATVTVDPQRLRAAFGDGRAGERIAEAISAMAAGRVAPVPDAVGLAGTGVMA